MLPGTSRRVRTQRDTEGLTITTPHTSPTETPELRPAGPGTPALEIHRSWRRRRSSQASLRDGRVVVRLPAGLPAVEEERAIATLVRRITGRARAAALGGDDALRRRADRLADTYLDGVRATEVRWSSRMTRLDGSCTPATGVLRINQDLARHPAYVLDYLLVHELAHLHHADHSPAFHALVARFPETQRAIGYLDGFAAGWVAGATPAETAVATDQAAADR